METTKDITVPKNSPPHFKWTLATSPIKRESLSGIVLFIAYLEEKREGVIQYMSRSGLINKTEEVDGEFGNIGDLPQFQISGDGLNSVDHPVIITKESFQKMEFIIAAFVLFETSGLLFGAIDDATKTIFVTEKVTCKKWTFELSFDFQRSTGSSACSDGSAINDGYRDIYGSPSCFSSPSSTSSPERGSCNESLIDGSGSENIGMRKINDLTQYKEESNANDDSGINSPFSLADDSPRSPINHLETDKPRFKPDLKFSGSPVLPSRMRNLVSKDINDKED